MEQSPPSPPPEPDPLAEARRLLAEDQQQRMQQCAEEIQRVLDRYGFRLEVAQPQITIVPA